MTVLAFHITWGTYGTRLHGDPRGTVDRNHNHFGDPVLGYDLLGRFATVIVERLQAARLRLIDVYGTVPGR